MPDLASLRERLPLPAEYAWLSKEPGPKMLLEALSLFGTLEGPGAKDNPTIMAWAAELALSKTYSHDSIPWCGLFMAIVAKRAGKQPVDSSLWALSWADFGKLAPVPMLGDVLTFKRNGGGHVALYVGEDFGAYHCLGGNQSDKVCITRIAKSRLYRARRPDYQAQPDNVRKVMLASSGKLSTNEA
ncbi:TIGR02594 family protein [Bradyrhizobium sp. SYSU BS000235]|uniref:TIGR02594 family protein n=1 Tax=Bradyrhizobium sp. SYSU BS000235 TaxID=3411332 RepID=UPI003C71E4FC